MTEQSDLDRLCVHYGVAAEYTDIWGECHRVPEHTRRTLLAATGVEANDPVSMQRALIEARERTWRRMLPPVEVLWEGQDRLELELTLPASHAEQMMRWVLQEETGARQELELRPSELEIRETRILDGNPWSLYRLVQPVPAHVGYHRVELIPAAAEGSPLAATTIIVAPRHCYQPEAVRENGRVWGFSAQLHALRSQRNWGLGDFTDLTDLVEIAADAGADMVGLCPLQALFPQQPSRCNPYEPSSRLFLNVLHLDVEAVAEFRDCREAQARVATEQFQVRLRALRASALVDFPRMAAAKLEILELLFRHFRNHHLHKDSPRAQAFRAFQAEQGEALYRHTLFEALQAHIHARDSNLQGWREWPEAYRDPDSEAVREFAESHQERLQFFAYLQWQAAQQLRAAARRSRELGLGVGLYQDLAVGVAPEGADVWGEQRLYASGVHIGAPPDEFSLQGQDWGILPWNPVALHELAYAPFVAALRRNMQGAGALRIDHVMGLLRLYWVPKGQSPADGGYVHYPFDDLLGIVTLESQRNRCMVIGEDLGTVPNEVREALLPRGVLSSRLLYFERNGEDGFKEPAAYEPHALVAVSTHDLPTLTGFWQGVDLEIRRQLELFPSAILYQEQLLRRREDRARLLLALEREKLLPVNTSADPASPPELTTELARAVHRYVARTPCRLMLVQLADVLGQTEQINLPGSGERYPNWRQRLPLELEAWTEQPGIPALWDALRRERGRQRS